MTRTHAGVAIAALSAASLAQAQSVGPDMVNSWLVDIQRYGTDTTGAVTAYAVGSVTCNHGDVPAIVNPSGSNIRPLVAMNMYRLKADSSGAFSRFEQVGQSWVKRVLVPGGASQATCGTCISGPPGTMGVGCADVYSSAFNGSQGLLVPRSSINPATAAWSGTGSPVGDATTRGRIQVATTDLVNQPASTRFFGETVMLLPDDAQYVRPGQAVAINALNNASTQEISVNGGTGSPTLMGSGTTTVPAVLAWQAIDPNVVIATVDSDETVNPSTTFPNTHIRSRFYAASRITDLGNGSWRYEYAIFNLNSDRAAGSVAIPLPSAAPISDMTFHAPLSHSGELYSNAAWTTSRSGDTLFFSTDAFAANPNANALRWGTTYNFGFTTPVQPVLGVAQLGLFKPGPTDSLWVNNLLVPTVPPARYCDADFNGNGEFSDDDIEAFFVCLGGNCCPTCESADFNGDGDSATDADIESFFRVMAGGPC